jgi:sugar phosphate isomerase/epimerase
MTSQHTSDNQRRISVSSWSLHRLLGSPAIYGVEQGFHIPHEWHNQGPCTLLELPTRLAAFGITTLEICHFHLPDLDTGYLSELRSALQAANIELFSLLIDEGDITHPTHAERDLAWIERWLEIAEQLGAKRARVIGGKSTSEEALSKSARALRYLSERAEGMGLRLMTENWFDVLSNPQAIHTLFEQLEQRVGLCLDFGNWKDADKYTQLASIASYAESCHTKANFSADDHLDQLDYVHCLDVTREARFVGPYTLIYDGPNDDEWNGLAREREIVQQYL